MFVQTDLEPDDDLFVQRIENYHMSRQLNDLREDLKENFCQYQGEWLDSLAKLNKVFE